MKPFNIRTTVFDFNYFILFHGWYDLAPFKLYENEKAIGRYLRNSKEKNTYVKISVSKGEKYSTLKVTSPEQKKSDDKDIIVLRNQIKRMLDLEKDYSDFHRLCRNVSALKFVYRNNCRGMLRSPNAFEDIVKTVCTTNCSWSNTKHMCISLCNLDGGNFPSPKNILKYSPDELGRVVPLGYRAKTVHQISQLVVEGELDLDKWAKNGDFERIKRALNEIKGVGEYSVNHMLALLGDYSNIPVDSEVLKYLRKVYFKGKEISPEESVRPFEDFGQYKFLVYKYQRMAEALS